MTFKCSKIYERKDGLTIDVMLVSAPEVDIPTSAITIHRPVAEIANWKEGDVYQFGEVVETKHRKAPK